jgi:D-glucosaminate-specific PTS system IIB component
VITKWSNTISVTRIIVVNDELASDEFMADVYRMAAPPMIDVDVIAIDQFVADAAAGAYATGNVMVLFRGIDDALAVIQRGVALPHVQIGGLGSGGGKITVVKGIAIDMADADKLTAIQDAGAPVTFQVTPEEPRLDLQSAIRKVR